VTAVAQTLARRSGATLFMVLLAAFEVLLSRLSGESDFAVGAPIAGRNDADVERLIGFFVNTLALRSDLAGARTFASLLHAVRRSTLDAHAHQEIPFEKLVEELQPARSLEHTPFFQAMFVLQNVPERRLAVRGLEISALDPSTGMAKFDLTLQQAELAGALAGAIEFAVDLFDPSTVLRWSRHFQAIMDAATADPARPLSELPLLGEGERAQLLGEWNDTAAPLPAGCFHELVARRASADPRANAVICADRKLTYGEVDRAAGEWAHRLRARGIGPESRVGLLAERAADTPAMLLGILKAGAAYVPLDPAWPRERLEWVAEVAGLRVALAGSGRGHALAGAGLEVLEPEEPAPPGLAADVGVDADNLAYVLFTSGSTGRPKGAMITHRGLLNYLVWAAASYEAERWCCFPRAKVSRPSPAASRKLPDSACSRSPPPTSTC
jgi:non-ribosomal peptide synthetase component F